MSVNISTQKCLNGKTLLIGSAIVTRIIAPLRDISNQVTNGDEIISAFSEILDELDEFQQHWTAATLINVFDRMIEGDEEQYISEFSDLGINLEFDALAECYVPSVDFDMRDTLTGTYIKKQV